MSVSLHIFEDEHTIIFFSGKQCIPYRREAFGDWERAVIDRQVCPVCIVEVCQVFILGEAVREISERDILVVVDIDLETLWEDLISFSVDIIVNRISSQNLTFRMFVGYL